VSAISKRQLPGKLRVRSRLLLSVLLAGVVSVLLPSWFHWPIRILCVWDSGMLCFLALTWSLMVKATPETMQRNAQSEDEGRLTILSLVTAAACASILAIGFMLKDSKGIPPTILVLHVTLAVVTIVGSWLLVHTIFASHYAHEYYRTGKSLEECKADGLDFPSDIEPDYWDFLYFSFIIGMTSQVSDVQVTSRSMRRLALLHGILSFFFNTAIVAMTINTLAGLINQ